MKRETLVKSPSYWLAEMQHQLYKVMSDYMESNHLTRKQLAKQLNVTPGYITQVLSGDYNHKLEKFVELSLACNKIPIVHFVDYSDYLEQEKEGKKIELYASHIILHKEYQEYPSNSEVVENPKLQIEASSRAFISPNTSIRQNIKTSLS